MKNEHEGTEGWKAGIQAALRIVDYRRKLMPDLQHRAYTAALDEIEIFLRAMLERGTEKTVSQLDAAKETIAGAKLPCGCHCEGGCGDPYAGCMWPCREHIPF